MEIKNKSLDVIKMYASHPRISRKAIAGVMASIEEFGVIDPILITKNNVIIDGVVRYEAFRKLKMEEIPTISLDLTEEQASAFRLVVNRVGELSTWDRRRLCKELKAIAPHIDMSLFGFTKDDMIQEDTVSDDKIQNVLAAGRLQVDLPPSSVIEPKGKEYNAIYDYYKSLGIISAEGRKNDLLGKGMKELAKRINQTSLNGTSVFNPVLCHCLYKWFNREGGTVFDPFAGGFTRGCIASLNNYGYIGIELRKEQVDANVAKAKQLGISPKYICDDSLNADSYIDDETADLILTCPPYYDREKYSTDQRDLSKMSPPDFIDTYKQILGISYRKLKEESFFVIVVSEVRNEEGFYRRFVLETIDICKSLGLNYWNEIILVNSAATAIFRARDPFALNRKVQSIHQNALVFYKGNPQEIAADWKKEVILSL